MLLTENRHPRQLRHLPQTLTLHDVAHYPNTDQQQQQQPVHQAEISYLQQSLPVDIELNLPDDYDIDAELGLDNDIGLSHSISSSPASTQSLLSQFTALQQSPQPARSLNNPDLASISLFPTNGMMHHHDASWLLPGQVTPKSASRLSHQRENSLSSLGSTGPASPYSHNSSNPQIAVTDTAPETYHGLQAHDEFPYRLVSKIPTEHFYNYTSYGSADAVNTPTSAYLAAVNNSGRGLDRSHLPPPDFPIGPNKSRPVSVASSVNSDSPATPSLLEPEEDLRRGRNVQAHPNSVPKLARTMTDIYSDELYSPNFTITSAPPSQSGQLTLSPTNDLFAQRIQAANSQHLTAAQSPVSTVSRGRSPFRQGSPLAPTPIHDFPSAISATHVQFGSAQKAREQNKAQLDAQVLHQQIIRGTDSPTPQTISPKDAMLEYHESDGDNNFPLFPPQDNSSNFSTEHISRVMAQANQPFGGLGFDGSSAFDNVQAQMGPALPVPQQYPFIAHPRTNGSASSMPMVPSFTSRINSMESNNNDGIQRPESGTSADGGTYTCTYHGCTLRFETPVLLQKHKREGHRQAHGLTTARRSDLTVVTNAGSPVTGMTSSLLNSQAGPHKCERINPGTGKPCNTVFSRPYDLTRHEDTIHNARKQKVRCDLCTDDKTFSRADALTRHYRVCHPDVEFPGKHRRRGVRSG